ncbi:spore protein O [Tumebacillus sp. ITR2]|uniref:Spore protein O n=1 Tax=Tumebacillus amylolyticus TaxID=2801339 RepID=A0ABS1JB62_9BACL|nr:glycosyl hydrolase family 18 protein [Tumebacillus amylolyticus]MBL0387519.1 spore protein O [Tumebacillus amylolyticus]
MKKKIWLATLVAAAGTLLAATPYALKKGQSPAQPTLAEPVATESTPADGPTFGPPMPDWQSELTQPLAVLGYYTVSNTNKSSLNSLNSFGGGFLNQMTTMTFSAQADGSIAGQAPPDGMQAAQQKQVKALASLTNGKDGFSKDVAHAVLSDPNLRGRLVQNAVVLCRQGGYGGVNVDFENMLPSDRANFTAFMTELANGLHADGRTLTISVMAKTSDFPKSDWIGTFDYAALGQVADQIQLMTYDQHGTWGEPGAVAGLPWVEKVVRYASSQIPSQKLLLGIAAYGYDWNMGDAGKNKAIPLKNIPALLNKTGAQAQWNDAEQSPYFTYTADDGSTHNVWYENPQSIETKAKLVSHYHLGGIAMWKMGFEDNSFWQAVKTGLQVPQGQ